MKEFAVYNLMRLLLLASWIVIVGGVWAMISNPINIFGVIILALIGSGISSWFLLARQREALAHRVANRVDTTKGKYEEMRKAPGEGDA